MKKLTSIILTVVLTASISTSVFAADIPLESAPCNAMAESIEITENLISDTLTQVENGMGFQPAWCVANNEIFNAVLQEQTNGYGYAEIASIARNAIIQYRDMYLRPEYYAEQYEHISSMISDLTEDVRNGKSYNEALKEAYVRIYQSIDSLYVANAEIGVDRIYMNIPAADYVMFTQARKLLLNAIPE